MEPIIEFKDQTYNNAKINIGSKFNPSESKLFNQSKINPTDELKGKSNPELKVVISRLSNQDLMGRFGQLVQTERKITGLVLECIIEIDRRKIYLEKAYPSLFEFLVKEFGYSPSSAMRRIESARLLREIPEMSEKIKSGAINLSQLAKVQQTIRAVQKTSNIKIVTAQKKEILNKIEFETQAKTELILAQEFNLPHVHFEKEKVHKDESITLAMTFTKEQMELLEQAQNLVSHAVPNKKWSEMFTYLAQKEIKSRSPKAQVKLISNSNRDGNNFCDEVKLTSFETQIPNSQENKIDEVIKINSENKTLKFQMILENGSSNNVKMDNQKKKFSKQILLKTRNTILDPQNACCQFKDPSTQKTCGSKKFLQMDHIQPRWAGGDNGSGNFQTLCAQHNRYRYKIQAGLLP